jgi:hypothetical protein
MLMIAENPGVDLVYILYGYMHTSVCLFDACLTSV